MEGGGAGREWPNEEQQWPHQSLRGRLQLEKGMRAGGMRLLGFLLVFLSLINAYMVVAPNKELFNLKSFFENSLDLAQFESARGLQDVRQELMRLSRDVKPLMLLSSSNLVDSVAGDMELIAEAQEFPQSQQLQLSPSTRVRVDGPEVCYQWIPLIYSYVPKVPLYVVIRLT